ncbi:DUF4892 domain-containing protein [Marinobacter salicampi]|uniref:DUF4892 domain-containing protein n=1 Tax=Marinobacter salicampi TaxID=435907 RepID=UPI00140BBC1E|nr:DUF4892 domain-containing protein [Marinobacter salicampi]
MIIKRITIVQLLALFMALWASPGVMAEDIPPYPKATVEKTVPIVSSGHRILLSAVREINDQIRSDSIVRLPVEGEGQLLQVEPDASRKQARQYYLDELAARNAIVLYRCEGRACGRSNVWANQIFNEARLYGRDTDQDYVAAAYQNMDGEVKVVLVYTVTRGNMREYVWVEQLTTESSEALPGFTAGSTRILGPIIIPWTGGVTFQFDYSANNRRQVREWAQEPGTKVLVNSYTELEESETLDSAMNRAREAAQSMAVLLGKSGVSDSQIMPIIIGPAVAFDVPSRSGNRIELKVVTSPE